MENFPAAGYNPSMTPRPLLLASVLCSAVLALLAAPPPAAAWSENGHRTVGQIAQDLLTKQAQAGDAPSQAALDAISGLLGQGNGLAALAPCADQVRELNEETGKLRASGAAFSCGGLTLTVDPTTEPWHFVNVPITASDTAESIAAQCGNDACVVSQIQDDLKVLQDPAAAQADKQKALMFLVHFVGDEHQPLHCATEIVDGKDDYGGNEKQVRFDGLALNMHALWDHLIQKTDNVNDPSSLSQQLEATLPADTSAWTQGDFVTQAALESFGIAQQTIYPAYYSAAGGSGLQAARKPNSRPKPSAQQSSSKGPAVDLPSDYQSQMQPIVMQRLQMAGVRLAALLKQSLGGAPSLTVPSVGAQKAVDKARRTAAALQP
jgi:hypothetical protein